MLLVALVFGCSVTPLTAQSDALWWMVDKVCAPTDRLLEPMSVCEYLKSDAGIDKRFAVVTDVRK